MRRWRRTWLSTWSAAPLRACPRRSTWPITRRRGRSWARERAAQRRKVMGSAVSLTMMTDSPHSHNSNHSGLRSGRHRSLLAKMPTPKPKKRRVKGFASRGLGKKWILVLLVVLLLIPAMQVAVVRFINPPLTLPMLINQSGAMFSRAPKRSAPLPLDRSAADS